MFTRLIGAVVGLVLLSQDVAHPEELRPLGDALAQETSIQMVTYVLTRCAALYTASASRMVASEREDAKNLIPQFTKVAAQYLILAVKFSKDMHPTTSDDELMRQAGTETKAILPLYLAKMDESYRATGNDFGDFLKAEFIVCKTLAE